MSKKILLYSLCFLLCLLSSCRSCQKCNQSDCTFLNDVIKASTSDWEKKNTRFSIANIEMERKDSITTFKIPVSFEAGKSSEKQYHISNHDYTTRVLPMMCTIFRSWAQPNNPCALQSSKLDSFMVIFAQQVSQCQKQPPPPTIDPKKELMEFLKQHADSIEKLHKTPLTTLKVRQLDRLYQELEKINPTPTDITRFQADAQKWIHQKIIPPSK